jgi:hypothetical protein
MSARTNKREESGRLPSLSGLISLVTTLVLQRRFRSRRLVASHELNTHPAWIVWRRRPDRARQPSAFGLPVVVILGRLAEKAAAHDWLNRTYAILRELEIDESDIDWLAALF